MNPVPPQPKIYHITHVDNLPGILQEGRLWSDAERIARGLTCALVGMSSIKRRRLDELAVDCHPDTTVGQYVPCYFCPRSVMLYILHRGNHAEVDYRGGQRPIVHLQADLRAVVAWAKEKARRWAFSDRNAGTRYANFSRSLTKLDRVNWSAVANTDFRDPLVKEGKQAEFLLHGSLPWKLIEAIGVLDDAMADQVRSALAGARHRPTVRTERSWYY